MIHTFEGYLTQLLSLVDAVPTPPMQDCPISSLMAATVRSLIPLKFFAFYYLHP